MRTQYRGVILFPVLLWSQHIFAFTALVMPMVSFTQVDNQLTIR